MYPSVREVILLQAFPTIKEGLDALNLKAVELEIFRDNTVYAINPTKEKLKYKLDTPDGISEFEKHLKDTGVTVSALLMHNNFGSNDFDGEVSWTITAVKVASALKIPAIRIDAIMHGEHEVPMEKNATVFADAMARVIDATANCKVDLGIENHGAIGNRPEFLDKVLSKVNSERLGVTIDTGNFYWWGHPLSKVYEIIEHFAPYCKHTHVKNIAYPENKREVHRDIGWEYEKYVSPLEDGDIDLLRIVKILKQAGYNGDFCLEDESLGKYSPEERKIVLKKDAEFLRKICQG
jgi:sugar phosphate isomerase/epimerase